MTTATTADPVVEKTQELCQSILDDPTFTDCQEKVEEFLADEDARAAYSAWQSKGQELQSLSHQGVQLSTEDISEFERLKTLVEENPVAAAFLAAEEAMNQLFASVTTRVQKTFQLGRMPTDDDLNDSGCCGGHGDGGGCCSH